jgi:hypothetical protein
LDFKNKFKTIRLEAEKSSYEAEFSKINGDLKQTWKLIRSLMQLGNDEEHIEALTINGVNITEPQLMANALNDSFSNIAQSLADKLPPSPGHFNSYLQDPHQNSMGILLTSP